MALGEKKYYRIIESTGPWVQSAHGFSRMVTFECCGHTQVQRKSARRAVKLLCKTCRAQDSGAKVKAVKALTKRQGEMLLRQARKELRTHDKQCLWCDTAGNMNHRCYAGYHLCKAVGKLIRSGDKRDES